MRPGYTPSMRIRSQLALTIFATGCLGVAVFVSDRYIAEQAILYGRTEERARAILEDVESIALPYLQSGDLRPTSENLSLLAERPRVFSIRILDHEGNVAWQGGRGLAAPPAETVRGLTFHQQAIDPVSRKTRRNDFR